MHTTSDKIRAIINMPDRQQAEVDLLTGIMTGILSLTRDVYTAAVMAVWLHGYLAERGTENHCMQTFDLESYPELMNELFAKHGY